MVIDNFPECILINISQINLIKTHPEEKSNRIKVIVSWKNGKKDYFYGVEEDINKIVAEWDLSQQTSITIPTEEILDEALKKSKVPKEMRKALKAYKKGKGIKKDKIIIPEQKHMLENGV